MTEFEDITSIALIQKDIAYMKDDVNDIKQGIKELSGVFVSKIELQKVAEETQASFTSLKGTQKEFYSLKEEVHDFKTTATAYRVIAGIIGGLIAFILTQIPMWVRLFIK